MKGDGQGTGQDFVQDAGFFFLTIENVDVADALGVFYFWRENKEREDKQGCRHNCEMLPQNRSVTRKRVATHVIKNHKQKRISVQVIQQDSTHLGRKKWPKST